MRKWRVGTVSMGLSLIFLGIALFPTQIKGIQMIEPLVLWWPFIMIVLGLEIITYFFVSRQESSFVRYDFISILFISVLGMIAIGFTLLTSTGIMKELQTVMQSETKTFELPEWEETIPGGVEKIIIETGNQRVKIDDSNSNKMYILGTYRTSINHKDLSPLEAVDEIALSRIVGNTMYVFMKDPVSKSFPLSDSTYLNATIVVPAHFELEVRGNYIKMDTYPLK